MDLNERGTRHPNRTQPNSVISQEVSQISTISRDQRRKRLSNRAVYKLTCLLSVYKIIVNDTIKTHRILEFKKFFYGRVCEKKELYRSNDLLSSVYDFFDKILKTWY